MLTMIHMYNGVLFPTKLNKWHLKRTGRRPYIDLTGWNMAHDFRKINMTIQKAVQISVWLLIQRKQF